MNQDEESISPSKTKDTARRPLAVSSAARAVRASFDSRPKPTDPEIVGLSALKEWANKMLPMSSILRTLILSEPDKMPRSQALSKMDAYAKLLRAEFQR
jgi:hypothetical protein